MGMARAFLNESKLVIMDEATANIDILTEKKIQEGINNFFKDSTILMIAHRLNTIMECDKILVLNKGELQEYDYLENLIANPNSEFGRMVAVNKEVKKYIS